MPFIKKIGSAFGRGVKSAYGSIQKYRAEAPQRRKAEIKVLKQQTELEKAKTEYRKARGLSGGVGFGGLFSVFISSVFLFL